jgi:glutamyl-tRNA reductase
VAEVDLLVCATSAPHPIVTTRKFEGPVAQRRGDLLCILDIAVPRDVLPDVGRLAGVVLYDVDDLEAVVEARVGARRKEMPAAERIGAVRRVSLGGGSGGVR